MVLKYINKSNIDIALCLISQNVQSSKLAPLLILSMLLMHVVDDSEQKLINS